MTAWVIYSSSSGALERLVLDDPEGLGLDMTGRGVTELDEMPDLSTVRWDNATRTFVPYTAPRWLTGTQRLALYTPAQHARARRMLTAVHPEGHPLAGQMVDPEGLVQRLIDFSLAAHKPLSVADPYHIQATALLRGLGVIESDEEAARILAGITPEEAAGGGS